MMRALNNFQQRFLLSLLGICLISFILFFSHQEPFQYLFLAAIGAVQAISLWEYYLLAQTKGFQPAKRFGTLFSILYVIWHYFSPNIQGPLFAFLGLSFICYFSRHPTSVGNKSIGNLGVTLFGFCYITLPLSLLIDLNFIASQSSWWIIYLIVTTKMTDTVAYIFGKTIGKHLLTPTLSPKKTIEGAIGGLLGSSLSSLLFATSFPAMFEGRFSHLELALLGIAIGIVAQIGDLAESLVKRDANVKDSSHMPGFGGMLDIVDSLLFTTPLLYIWLSTKGIV